MLKKLLVIGLTIVLVITMTSCGSSEIGAEDDYAISVEKGMFDTEIVIPRAFSTTADIEPEGFENEPFEIMEIAKKAGVKDIVKNGDTSITMKMKNSMYTKLLTQIKISMDEYAASFIEENEEISSFRESSHDIKFTEFNIKVNLKEYEEEDILSTMPFYFLGMMYQSLVETPIDEIETTVNILDKDTENLIHTDKLTFEEYTEILDGSEELSTEEQKITMTESTEEEIVSSTEEKDSTASSSEASSTSSSTEEKTSTEGTAQATTVSTADVTTQATTETTVATTQATTVATTQATTQVTTQATTAATTQATTRATTQSTQATAEQSDRDLPAGNYKDLGAGSIRLMNSSDDSEGGNSPVITGNPSSTSSIRLIVEDFDVTHISYIYIDGMLAAKTRLTDQQDLQLMGEYLSAGTHKLEVVQYGNNDPENEMITYKTASYQVRAQ